MAKAVRSSRGEGGPGGASQTQARAESKVPCGLESGHQGQTLQTSVHPTPAQYDPALQALLCWPIIGVDGQGSSAFIHLLAVRHHIKSSGTVV